ncbi:MAG: glycoside hydrolase family 3 C-terminal domain-containing protein [Saprospirales bacterium]|nr:glycoside hydrolase family 3 C-terminal domain-containing protein [Saprospirales bacterium]
MRRVLPLFLAVLLPILAYAQSDTLLAQMSPKEKLEQLFISAQSVGLENTRLDIPELTFAEALHGLATPGSTAFPQAIALAATFDTLLMQRVAGAIATECRAQGVRMVLSPVLNLATDVRWGRVEETYGEDPFLTSQMGLHFVGTFEQMGVVTCPKHFVVNHGEGGRDSYPIHYSERYLEETHLAPFKTAVLQGGARSIMTAYNSLDGRPCTAHDWLLREKLKGEWGFRGFVISDAGATGGANVLHFTAADYEDAGQQAIENGLDLIFQTSPDHLALFERPFLDGSIDQAVIDSAVARVAGEVRAGAFRRAFRRGFKPDGRSPGAVQGSCPEIDRIAENDERKVLPLSPEYRRIAVIGPDAVEARLGGYSGPGNEPVNIPEGFKGIGRILHGQIRRRARSRGYALDLHAARGLFHEKENRLEKGLQGTYFSNIDMTGEPALERIDPDIRFQWTLFSPDPAIPYDFFSVKWEGVIVPPVSGQFQIGIDGNDGYRLYLDDKLLLDTWRGQSYHTTLADVDFEEGVPRRLRIEYAEPSGNAWFRLIWTVGVQNETEEKIREAVALAQASDAVIMVAGIEEGEFRDRSILSLPGRQEELILQLAETGKPLVVVLVGGSAITMERWIDRVNAVVDVWYPGEMGGEAVAEVLTGRYNPAGRLPITFPMREGQLPLVYNHKPTGRGDDYVDGSGQPLFPFGYGLSYTEFEYTDAVLDKPQMAASDTAVLSFTLKNTGAFDGEEVVQLYIRDELSSVSRPVKELKGFQRVFLKAGSAQRFSFAITPEMLSMLNEDMETVVEPGFFRIMIGGSSRDVRVREWIEIK